MQLQLIKNHSNKSLLGSIPVGFYFLSCGLSHKVIDMLSRCGFCPCFKSFHIGHKALADVRMTEAQVVAWMAHLTGWDNTQISTSIHVDDDASSLMCTANTKTNTKQMQGVQGKHPIRLVYEMRWKPTKADEAYPSWTVRRHSVRSDNMGNSCRALCEHLGTHADTQHSVREAGGYARNTGW
jgi:hypothetical protein